MIEFKSGLGKDGSGSYVQQFPTRYFWTDRVKRLVHRVGNEDRFEGEVWFNTYEKHPPAFPWPKLSADAWGFGGRGDPIGDTLGNAIWRRLFQDPDPPDIYWCIWDGRMFVRSPDTFKSWFEPSPAGPPGSDAEHRIHSHWSYFNAEQNRRFRRFMSLAGSPQERALILPRTVEEAEAVIPVFDEPTEFGRQLAKSIS